MEPTGAAIRKNVLNSYKNMLKLCKKLPVSKQTDIRKQIKDAFRNNSNETNSTKIKELVAKAQSSLGYLKIITPKSTPNGDGHTKIVFNSSQSSKSNGTKAMSNWTGKNLDPDSVKRHYDTLKRMGYKDNNQPKGPMGIF